MEGQETFEHLPVFEIEKELDEYQEAEKRGERISVKISRNQQTWQGGATISSEQQAGDCRHASDFTEGVSCEL